MLPERSGDYFLTIGVVLCRSHVAQCFNMSTRGDIASTNTTSKGQKGGQKGMGVERT